MGVFYDGFYLDSRPSVRFVVISYFCNDIGQFEMQPKSPIVEQTCRILFGVETKKVVFASLAA